MSDRKLLVRVAMLIDLVIVFAGVMLVAVVGQLADLPASSQIAIVVGVLLASWRLAARSESWSAVGLRRPGEWDQTALDAAVLYLIVVAGVGGVVNPLAQALGWSDVNLTAYTGLRSNALQLALQLLMIWTTVAFGEELLFRGFILGRIERLIGKGAAATVCAVILQAALFGAGHTYLGMRGVAIATFVGVVYGTWYASRDRNLWPLIISHGLTDTFTMVAIYAGRIS